MTRVSNTSSRRKRTKVLLAPTRLETTMLISEIKIGTRHRKDMGDIEALAESIRLEGLLQPVGVTEKKELVFGARRLAAVRDVLRRDWINVRTVKVTSIVAGEYHENEVRKDFTPSERVAIEREINAEIERQPTGRGKCGQNFGRICDRSALFAGFGNRETARQARKVVEQGAPELIEAMDRGEVSISTAAEIADLPKEQQGKRLKLPSKQKALAQSRASGKAVLANDGKHHFFMLPAEKEKFDLWRKCKRAIWPISELAVDVRAAVAAVPVHQRNVLAQRLERAGVIIQVLKTELRFGHV
jgi:ParB-like chromosome segregation protein Spo0J